MSSRASRSAATQALDNAVNSLKQSITPTDAAKFQSATLEELWTTLRDVQQVQRDRQSVSNLTRIQPLLEILEKYSKPIEVCCNGTPYMPWIWVGSAQRDLNDTKLN